MTTLGLRGLRGGAGGSSLLAALGYALYTLEQRVLLVDMCADNLLRLHFNLAVAQTGGWARAWLDGQDWKSEFWEVAPNLTLLPYGRLVRTEQQQMEQELRLRPERWAHRIGALAANFDWILFDLPQRSLRHESAVSCQLQIEVIEADAACHVLLQQQEERTDYLLLNRFDPASQIQRDLMLLWRQQYDERLLPVIVHSDEAMREALACKQPVGRYAPHSLVAQDVLSLAVWCRSQQGAPT
ncbi:cellulose synthase operon protein YhjQ [Pseudomonas sp. B21-028]|uniref:cellulose biosynthesis protein BcsQ n=1 Tax=Pseudomonas sp. B21-028 TaxID=2895480 RepID=UPI00215F81BD|nr:cellulose biosynthesis protein BcsQ [Pseudomonas sp. B21-028]UVL86467.1 cellulose synthase operon protein YhjQ [Pseudomonas sp. B21-028]